MNPVRTIIRNGVCSTVAAIGLLPPAAMAQAFPDRAVTIVVPFAAGSRTDIVGRTLGNELAPVLKQPVVVENRSGANQIVGGSYVARAAPNGYTLLMVTLPSVTPAAVQKTLPYASMADFAAIAIIGKSTGLLVAAANVPANNLAEFVALLKANPGKYSYGSGGIGSPLHLFIEMFNKEAGVTAINIPYKSINAVMMDIVAGHIAYGYVSVAAMEYVKIGKLKALGMTSLQRSPFYPEVPTLADGGLKGFEVGGIYAIATTKGTPPAIVEKLNAAVNAAIASEGFTVKMRTADGLQVSAPQTPAQAGAVIAQEEERWNALVKARNIALE